MKKLVSLADTDTDHDRKREGAEKSSKGSARLILSSAEFIAGFVPPDYLVDNLLQRRFIDSLTAPTGAGKTAIALLLAASTALGLPIGKHPVEKGRVVFFSGENPDDVRMRWIGMAARMGFDTETIDAHFIPGVFSISQFAPRIRHEAQTLGGIDLVIIDTSAAYFEGDDENANVPMGDHARMLRELVTLPGGPVVLVLCHPVKNASNDNLLPRGGGAFLNEMDGNLVCLKNNLLVDVHWQGKFRGPDFEPVAFELISVTSDNLKDSKGRNIPTVIAKALTEKEQKALEATARSNEDKILIAMSENEGASMSRLAELNDWLLKDRTPNKPLVQRTMKKLEADRLVKKERGTWELTEKGEKAAKKARNNQDLAGSHY